MKQNDKDKYTRILIYKKNNGVGLPYTCRAFTSESQFLRVYTVLKKTIYIPIQDIEYIKVLQEGLISDLKINYEKGTFEDT